MTDADARIMAGELLALYAEKGGLDRAPTEVKAAITRAMMAAGPDPILLEQQLRLTQEALEICAGWLEAGCKGEETLSIRLAIEGGRAIAAGDMGTAEALRLQLRDLDLEAPH